MTYTFEFLAPDVLLNMNDRTHWRKRAVQVKNWRTAAFAATRNTTYDLLPPCYVTITLPVRDSRKRDPSNWFPTAKACVDGMRDAGLWPDDDSTWVTVMEPKLEKRTVRYVTVELVPR
jgi:hypothetical protein